MKNQPLPENLTNKKLSTTVLETALQIAIQNPSSAGLWLQELPGVYINARAWTTVSTKETFRIFLLRNIFIIHIIVIIRQNL